MLIRLNKILGGFILERWINGDYQSTWLRRINRETKTMYISDGERVLSEKKNKDDITTFINAPYKAARFRKRLNGKFTAVRTHLHNPHCHAEVMLISDMEQLVSPYSYDELFKVDVREFQDKGSRPLTDIDMLNTNHKDGTNAIPYVLDRLISKCNRNDTSYIGGWDSELIGYLEDTFKVPVYQMSLVKIEEHDKQTKLTKAAIQFEITHFGGDKKLLTQKENYMNRAIQFWLFPDKLVFHYLRG